jgi:P2-related tail formation protein
MLSSGLIQTWNPDADPEEKAKAVLQSAKDQQLEKGSMTACIGLLDQISANGTLLEMLLKGEMRATFKGDERHNIFDINLYEYSPA